MKLTPLFFATLALPLSAQLRITEVMPDSNHSDSNANGDWFEITNTGINPVNVSGFSFDDDSATAGSSGSFPSHSLAAGESLIVLNEVSATNFRTLWNLPATFRIITNIEISDYQGLGRNGDAVFLYNNFGTLIDSFPFGSATEGFTFARFDDGTNVPGNLSIEGLFESYESDDPSGDIGSPGIAASQPEPLPPFFNAPFNTAWIAGSNLAASEFRIQSIDPNPGDTLTITTTGTPSWLSVVDLGNGIARLAGTPPTSAIGRHEFNVTATDSTNQSTSQTYQIDVLSASSSIILNEYNAVADDAFLDGGDEDDLDGAADPRLNRIAGNGGGWVEFTITGPLGTPDTTVDLRNWTLRIENDETSRILKLADHPALAAIPTGTILTFTENAATAPTGFNMDSQLNAAGYTWSNIWIFDPILIDQANSTQPDERVINSSNTRFTWLNGSDAIVYGPAGESIAVSDSNDNGNGDESISVGGTETFRLEENPAASISPLNLEYDDGGTSTFGLPNIWSANTLTQAFDPFRTGNTPPVFSSIAVTTSARGAYDEQVSITSGSTVTALTLPDFLNVTTAGSIVSITNNRPLTAADIGTFEVTLEADTGFPNSNLSYLTYQLLVLNPSPSVILNEYNAVDATRFLNDGTLAADGDGFPAAADSHFGRIAGNGGNWFELAVVGDGSAGVSNLTNWSIEVGQIQGSGQFEASSTIVLSDAATWSSVTHGTLLTFIDRDSANGGLDTEVNRINLLSTDGYAWTNIHLNTGSIVTGTGLANLAINSSNTAFVIRDAAGTIIFGPAGEGIAPLDGVGGSEIFELESSPSPLVASIDAASATSLGYDDGSSGSTFGSPNLFAPIGSTIDQAQDFSPFVISLLDAYFAGFGIPDADLAADDDGDGFSNLDEYLLAGDPTNPGIIPQTTVNATTGLISLTVRTNDPNFVLTPERSTNLIDWFTDQLTITDEASPLGNEFRTRNFTFQGTAPRMFFRVNTNP